MMLKLQDIAINYIIQNFQCFFANKTIWERWLRMDIPPLFTQMILERLDDWLIGIPEEYLKFCTRAPYFLPKMKLNCKRIKEISSLEFLQGQHFKKVIISNLKQYGIEDWMNFLESSELIELSIRGCKLNKKEQANGFKNIEYMHCFKRFKNLSKLNLSFTNITNAELKFITIELHQIEHLNISHTHLTKLCSLVNFSKLLSLDCSFPHCKSIYDSYLVLLDLKHLRYLDISRKTSMTCERNPLDCEEIFLKKVVCLGIPEHKFFYYKSWSISEFIDFAYWKDMTHLNVSGDWELSSESAGNFIKKHKKLEFIGLYRKGSSYRTQRPKNISSNEFDRLTRYSDDIVSRTFKAIPLVKDNIPIVEILVRNLVCHVEMSIDEERLRSRLEPEVLKISEVIFYQLGLLKQTLCTHYERYRENIFVLDQLIVILQYIDIRKSPYFMDILKTCYQILELNKNCSILMHSLSGLLRILHTYFKYIPMVINKSQLVETLLKFEFERYWMEHEIVLITLLSNFRYEEFTKDEILSLLKSFLELDSRSQQRTTCKAFISRISYQSFFSFMWDVIENRLNLQFSNNGIYYNDEELLHIPNMESLVKRKQFYLEA
ncbi:DgyrCDS8608 [Dimorphilus gyrociliatus]|uniref:DgyrCDS8608 n=1 Tax=Dimorphilus gyrociliatus TaxID=2664684 RepID=A0A7I8VWC5_9ANNE|nr:DgyrCDS8608 [Dimorphilus gyrociliatus]